MTINRQQIPEPSHGKPHVVILGAGASLAAFPNGDRHGRKLPLLWNIVDLVGLGHLLDQANVTDDRKDFEKVYSNLVSNDGHSTIVDKIDAAIFRYFSEMELPESPTLYDHLVASLRSKDVIATFNWDPFLWQAIARSPYGFRNVLFLHGNTAIGCCTQHKPIAVRPRGQNCQRCGLPLSNSKLLYPVQQKNYTDDPFISVNWSTLQSYLEDAYLVTVFGYSAPKTDVEAISLLKSAWGDPGERTLEEIEIIDIKDEQQLRTTWDDFIHSHHYQTTKVFWDSMIARHPRRSCEAFWSSTIDINPIEPNPISRDASWQEFEDFYDVLFNDENSFARPKGAATT